MIQARTLLATAFLFMLALPALVHAQDPVETAVRQRLGRDVSQAEILQQLAASGLSRADVQNRLRQAGYDPNLLDAYLDRMPGRGADTTAAGLSELARRIPPPSGEILGALRSIGFGALVSERAEADSTDLEELVTDSAAQASEIFGRSLFAHSTSQFDPTVAGPVDAEYQVGPGDQLVLVITGDVELAYNLDVTRDGYVVIPDVGQVFVAGRTLGELRDVLQGRLGRVYSGISRSANASTRFDVSLGRLRSLLVYLVGDVRRPGGYQVSAVSKAFNALYRGGGPTDRGSFRNIEVRRGGRTMAVIDVYDYLLRGDTRNDIRLDQGDIVFVPPAGAQVEVRGSVRREGVYELKDGEGLREVLTFAGGLAADAFVRRIQIDRILPFAERTPERDRVLIDVNLEQLLEQGQNPPLRAGDIVTVFTVSEERRNRVAVTGEVSRPGAYEYRSGMTVRDLVAQASGLRPTAYTATAHLYRTDWATGRRTLIRVALDSLANGGSSPLTRLEDLDSLVVFGRPQLLNEQTVAIEGLVKEPGEYTLAAGMSVQDLVLAAGGFTAGAVEYEAEVARMVARDQRTDTLAFVLRIPLAVSVEPGGARRTIDETAASFQLQHGDRVYIRQLAGYAPIQSIEVTGEVLYPGTYAVERRSQTISSIIRRAGGLSQQAHLQGFRLVRKGKPVAANLDRALNRPGSKYDLALQPGDTLQIPRYDPTVLVTGAVAFEARVPYDEDLSLDDYLNRAGGVLDTGNRSRVSVQYANGSIATSRRTAAFRRDPDVQAGATIVVPVRAANTGFNWDSFLTKTLAVLSTLATVSIAAAQLK